MSSKQKTVLAVLGCGVFVLLLAVLLKKEEPIEIGFVAGFSGKFADLGIDCRRGVELATAKINEEGGINGQRVSLIVRDDKQDPEEAKRIIQSYLEMDLPVIIGHVTSSMTMSTLPLINNSRSLLVSPTTSTPLLTDKDDGLIRVCAVSTNAAVKMAKYLREKEKVDSAAVIYDTGNRAYTEQWYEYFSRTFLENGGKAILPLVFDSAPDLQLLPLVEKARAASPGALVIVSNSVDGALLCQQVKKTGWKVVLALADWAATEQLIELGGDAVEGAVISQYFHRNNSNPAYLAFKERFLRAYKTEPGFGAQHSYNAAMMIAISMKGQQKTESLKEAILRISRFEGLQGEFTINEYGDSSHQTFIGVIENHDFNMIESFQ